MRLREHKFDVRLLKRWMQLRLFFCVQKMLFDWLISCTNNWRSVITSCLTAIRLHIVHFENGFDEQNAKEIELFSRPWDSRSNREFQHKGKWEIKEQTNIRIESVCNETKNFTIKIAMIFLLRIKLVLPLTLFFYFTSHFCYFLSWSEWNNSTDSLPCCNRIERKKKKKTNRKRMVEMLQEKYFSSIRS